MAALSPSHKGKAMSKEIKIRRTRSMDNFLELIQSGIEPDAYKGVDLICKVTGPHSDIQVMGRWYNWIIDFTTERACITLHNKGWNLKTREEAEKDAAFAVKEFLDLLDENIVLREEKRK